MIQNTVSQKRARAIYDFLGARYDLFDFVESKAKQRAIDLLELSPGQDILNVGVGTGKQHIAPKSGVSPGGQAFALDLSPVMTRLAKNRTGAPVFISDAGNIPMQPNRLDSIYCAYVLDMLPLALIPDVIYGFRRILKPGGRLVVLSLTEGLTSVSRALLSFWKKMYVHYPVFFAGCRPLQNAALIKQAGFTPIRREVVVQFALPSEIILAFK